MQQLWIAIVLVICMAARQLTAQPINRKLYTIPVLALVYGLYVAYGHGAQNADMLSLLISAALGGVVGFLQGRFIRVFDRNGVWMMLGSVASVAIWLLSVPIRFAVHYGFDSLSGIEPVLTGSLAFVPFLFSIAGIMLGRVLYLTLKYPNEMMTGVSMSRRERRWRIR
jgi:hypothetical protein